MNRLYNLDYLRGIAAFGIMLFHYLAWSQGRFTADEFMGRVGVYGVSIFYVLSGLTLYYVYFDKMQPVREEVIAFFRKRFFRIFPLLWLVTIAAVILKRELPNFTDLFLNLSGLFGFVKWDVYFSAGVWSIGNELVFYVFFPFFILFTKKLKPLMVLLSIAIFGLYLYFAFWRIDSSQTLDHEWREYVNPLNQVFLFLGGFLIGLFFQNTRIKNSTVLVLLLLALGIFTFYPASANPITLVTGTNRLVFTACCFVICLCFYKLTFQFPGFIHKPLTLLGEASYSVYLLHPIVWAFSSAAWGLFNRYLFQLPQPVMLVMSIVATLAVSYFVYQYFEKYFMKLGRRKKG